MDENVEAAQVTESAQRLSVAEIEGRYLPQKIVHNILSRVPLKSLVRFQSVCRNWRCMISDLGNNFAVNENVGAALVTELAQRLSVTEMEGRYLPQDIARNILARLPLKSLARFQSVCKNWCSMTSDLDAVQVQQSMSKVTITYGTADGRCLFFKLKDKHRHVCCLSLKTEYIWAEKACSNNKFVLFSADFEDYGAFIQPMDGQQISSACIKVPCQPWETNCCLLKIKESLCFMNTASVDELHIWMLNNSESLWILKHEISLSSMVFRPISLTSFLLDNFNPWLVVEGISTTYIMVTLGGIHVPYWYNIETKELSHISMAGKDFAPFCEADVLGRLAAMRPQELRRLALAEVFCLRTISFIDGLRPDFQSKFSGFIIAERERQRREREREQDHEQLRSAREQLRSVRERQQDHEQLISAREQLRSARERQQDHEQLRRDAFLGKSSEPETATPAAPTRGRYVPRRVRGKNIYHEQLRRDAFLGKSSEPETATPAAPTRGRYVPRRVRGKNKCS